MYRAALVSDAVACNILWAKIFLVCCWDKKKKKVNIILGGIKVGEEMLRMGFYRSAQLWLDSAGHTDSKQGKTSIQELRRSFLARKKRAPCTTAR